MTPDNTLNFFPKVRSPEECRTAGVDAKNSFSRSLSVAPNRNFNLLNLALDYFSKGYAIPSKPALQGHDYYRLNCRFEFLCTLTQFVGTPRATFINEKHRLTQEQLKSAFQTLLKELSNHEPVAWYASSISDFITTCQNKITSLSTTNFDSLDLSNFSSRNEVFLTFKLDDQNKEMKDATPNELSLSL